MKRIVVIGGGISGLAAANRLLEQARQAESPVVVQLIEASSKFGGIIRTEERDGFLLERGPDSFISEKPAALELSRRLGLDENLIPTNPSHRRSFIVRKGRLRPVPEGFQLLAPSRLLPFFRSDIFSWRGKARITMDLVVPRGQRNGLVDESLAQFVRRRFGREALERMAQPMVGGIYTADPEKLSLQATMPRFLEMERQRRSLILAMRSSVRRAKESESNDGTAAASTSGARYSLFLSYDRGMQLLTDSLAQRITTLAKQRANGEPLIAGTRIQQVELTCEGGAPQWHVKTSTGNQITADAICLALPSFSCGRLLRNVDGQLADELDTIDYASSATINLAYRRADIPHPLDGFGFVVPFIEGRSIIACTFSSVKFLGRAPADHVLLRVFIGGALQPEVVALPETEILARVKQDLLDLLGITRAPIFHEVSIWENSMPQYHLGHLDRVKRIRERAATLPGLALAGNAYSGPGIPDCIRSGEEAATALLGSLESRHVSGALTG